MAEPADSEAITEAGSAVEEGRPAAIAAALGQFCDELAKYASVGPDELREFGGTFLQHLCDTWIPNPNPQDPEE